MEIEIIISYQKVLILVNFGQYHISLKIPVSPNTTDSENVGAFL